MARFAGQSIDGLEGPCSCGRLDIQTAQGLFGFVRPAERSDTCGDVCRGCIRKNGRDVVIVCPAIARAQVEGRAAGGGQGEGQVAVVGVGERIDHDRCFGDNAWIGHGNGARHARGNARRNDLRRICRTQEYERFIGSAGEFQLARAAAVAAHRIAVVALLVLLDITIAANARDVGIDAQSNCPRIEGSGDGRCVVGDAQGPLTGGRLIAKTCRIGNGELRPIRAGIRRNARGNCRSGRIAEGRGREVRRRPDVRRQITLDAKGRNEPRIDMTRIGMSDVDRRNDFAHDAGLGDVDEAGNAALRIVGNGRGRALREQHLHFTRAASNIELTSAGAAIAVDAIAIVALLGTRERTIAAAQTTLIGTSVRVVRIAVVAFFAGFGRPIAAIRIGIDTERQTPGFERSGVSRGCIDDFEIPRPLAIEVSEIGPRGRRQTLLGSEKPRERSGADCDCSSRSVIECRILVVIVGAAISSGELSLYRLWRNEVDAQIGIVGMGQ